METIIDTSSFFNFDELDKTISHEQFLDVIITNLERIMVGRFPSDPIKQKIRVHTNKRINFSCPYCGDSMQNSWKQRGNIILEGKHKYYYKCFNCGEFKRVDHFLKDFHRDLNLDAITYITNNKGDFHSMNSKYDISLLLDIPNIEKYAIDRSEIKDKLNVLEVKNSSVWLWLNKRLQFEAERFLYHPFENYIIILNLTPSGKILGFQKRNFSKYKRDVNYLTYSLSGIYDLLGRTEKVPEEINMLSQIFDICKINFSQPITLFEGPLDAFLFPNAIANGGANKNFPIEIPIRYFYDDDKTGRENAIKRINEGYQIFLWDRLKNDYNLPPTPPTGKRWDLTDFMMWIKTNKIIVPIWDKYFSNDPLDIIDL